MTEKNLFKINWLDKVDSTNNEIKILNKKQNLPDFSVLCTHFQSAGKGQVGNSWESEKGKNLTFSILIKPKHIQAHDQFLISKAVSLGIWKVFQNYASQFSIKWPNDIYYKNYKIGGILIENTICSTNIHESIIGIGLNINQQKFFSDAPNPISLRNIINKDMNLDKFLIKILSSIKYNLDLLKSVEDTDLLNQEYINSLFRKNDFHTYKDDNGIFEASIKGIADYGQLVLETSFGDIRKYSFKEVEFIL